MIGGYPPCAVGSTLPRDRRGTLEERVSGSGKVKRSLAYLKLSSTCSVCSTFFSMAKLRAR